MKIFINLLLGLITILYPIAVYFGLQHIQARFIVLLLACVFIMRFFLTQKTNNKSTQIALLSTVLLFSLIIFLSNSSQGLLLYPVIVNLVMLLVFSVSLFFPPSMIERLARLKDPQLPEQAIPYTRNVTKIWCLFFIINGSIAAYTAYFCDLKTWTLYNGFIAYILIAALFVGEILIRPWIKQRVHKCQ